MEKRILIPKETPANSDLSGVVAKASADAANSAYLVAKITEAVQAKLSGELAMHARAIQAIVDMVKPRQKTIDIKVTGTDSDGNPTDYRVTVN